jgi:hypothetical protein
MYPPGSAPPLQFPLTFSCDPPGRVVVAISLGKDFPYCKDCGYIPYCRGGCPALAYTITGDENKPSPDACYRAFLESGGKLP